MKYIFFNGRIINADEPIAGARNRGLRYGDGLFETMLVRKGNIVLGPLHFERLFHGLSVLQFPIPVYLTPAWLTEAISTLLRRNNLDNGARVRLNIFRGNGSLFTVEEKEPFVVIESEPLTDLYSGFNTVGWRVDIYDEVRKSCDILSNLKSNNYLPYILAANYARRNKLNDSLLLNSYGRLCDSTIANLFWIKDRQVFTPPLTEGCVAGVMRRYLIQKIQETDFPFQEKTTTADELLKADEIFFTNSLFGIRWVEKMKTATYSGNIAAELYERFVSSLLAS